MASFVDRFFIGAGKVTFEAEKERRVLGVQMAIRGLRAEAEKMYGEIGRVAFALFGSGRIAQPELVEICQQLTNIRAQIEAREGEIEAIRAEVYVEPGLPGRACPNGHKPLTPKDKFCPTCGAPTMVVAPPASPARFCQQCGFSLSAEASFCPNCGKAVGGLTPIGNIAIYAPPPIPTPITPLPDSGRCPQCQSPLLPNAILCSACGFQLPIPESPPTAEPTTLEMAKSNTQPLARPAPSPDFIRCPSCDSEAIPGMVFCLTCGYKLQA